MFYCYGLNCAPSYQLCIEALNSIMTTFGYMAFKEVSKVKWVYNSGVLIQQDYCLYKKRKRHQQYLPPSPPAMYKQKKDM